MHIFIGADHRGYQLKKIIKEYFTKKGVSFDDVGNLDYDPNDDFPIFAQKVADEVVARPDSLGIVVCGSGVGVDIAANKVKGARTGLALNTEQVISARKDDNINILALAADYVENDTALAYVDAFLQTAYEPTENHERRLEKITDIEHE